MSHFSHTTLGTVETTKSCISYSILSPPLCRERPFAHRRNVTNVIMGKTSTSAAVKDAPKSSKSNKKSEAALKKKPVANPSVVSKEIDDLFGSVLKKSSKKTKVEKKEDSEDEEGAEAKSKRPKHRSSNEPTYGVMKTTHGGDIVNPEAPLERIDAESGLPVYKAHLLKVGEGGGTPLCPFDCNCCF